MEDINKAVAALATLILAHHRRIRAYLSLREITSRKEIRSLCDQHIDHSRLIVKNLSNWRAAYGGFAKRLDESVGSDPWLQVKLLLSLNAEKTIINRCEQLERTTLNMYKSAIAVIPSLAVGDLQSDVKALGTMMSRLQDLGQQKQQVGSLAMK